MAIDDEGHPRRAGTTSHVQKTENINAINNVSSSNNSSSNDDVNVAQTTEYMPSRITRRTNQPKLERPNPLTPGRSQGCQAQKRLRGGGGIRLAGRVHKGVLGTPLAGCVLRTLSNVAPRSAFNMLEGLSRALLFPSINSFFSNHFFSVPFAVPSFSESPASSLHRCIRADLSFGGYVPPTPMKKKNRSRVLWAKMQGGRSNPRYVSASTILER